MLFRSDSGALLSIESWASEAKLANLRPPVRLDAGNAEWPEQLPHRMAAVIAINLCHISPWEVTLGLLAGAPRALVAGGRLLIYGPFTRQGEHTAPSNAAFDQSLRRRDPSHGVRDLDQMVISAPDGLELVAAHEMPSNNLMAEFRCY